MTPSFTAPANAPARWRRAAVRLSLVGLALMAAGCGADDDAAADDGRLPAVTLVALEEDGSAGADFRLDDDAPAPRVINLWATWCAPCRAELPAFDRVAAEAGAELAMLGVNVGESPDQAIELVAELGIGFPQGVDPTGDITAELGVAGLPATVFASADGEILDVHGGALTAGQLVDRIDEVFGLAITLGDDDA